MGIAVQPLTAAMAEHTAELRARHKQLRLADAMVLACALGTEAELLTYDERLARLAPSRQPAARLAS
jgi:predicted nucleic acid-binding protein